MKNKYSYLSKNILLFSISSFGQKILAFLLVPLYTSVLSTADYGTVDLITTTVSILVPVFTINISEGVLRFTLKDKDNKDYFSYGIYMTIKAALILLVLLFLLSIIPVEYSFKKYYAWMYLIFIANCIYSLFQNCLRAVDKVPIMVFSSLLNTVVMLVSNIILLVYIKIGITGYFVSMFLGIMAANIYMLFKGKLVRCITLDFKNNPKMKKECISYCFPTIFTALAWWINSSLDKYFVTGMLGVSENGIYSVSYKIPTILGVFQNIFSQAWMLSAINEYDADDSDGFFGKTYEMYNSLMIFCCEGIMIFNILLSRILYAKDFFVAWKYVPLLLLSSLFSALSGYLGSIFSAVKDTKIAAKTTMISALLNALLNAVLIPKFHIYGAAVATVCSYVIAWGIRYIVSKRYVRMKINEKRMLFAYVLLVLQTILASTKSHFYLLQIIIILITMLLFRKYYIKIFSMVIKKIKKEK